MRIADARRARDARKRDLDTEFGRPVSYPPCARHACRSRVRSLMLRRVVASFQEPSLLLLLC